MNTAVSIERGYYVIDTHAWTDQRTGARHDVLTDALRAFLAQDVFTEYRPGMDMSARMQLWCAAREWQVVEGAPIHHEHACLTTPVTVVLAATPPPEQGAYALVQVGDDQPVVHADVTSDPGYWYQVSAVDIVCPGGHWWTWPGGNGLRDQNGQDRTVSAVFGVCGPYTRCRDCAAFEDSRSDSPCDCGDVSAIYCPICHERCQLALTEVPVHPSADTDTDTGTGAAEAPPRRS